MVSMELSLHLFPMNLPSQLPSLRVPISGLCLALGLVLSMASVSAQNCSDTAACNYNPNYVPSDYQIIAEVVASDIGPLVGTLGTVDLTGYTTTRLYFQTTNPNDFVTSVSGTSINPTSINTTTDFYQAALGAGVPNGINDLLFSVYPDLAYDSWVTIGIEVVPDAGLGEANVATVQSSDNAWFTNFDPGGGLPGGNVNIDDEIGGAWYVLNGDANGVPDAEGRVLLGQFTTTGEVSGNLQVQIFPDGDNDNFIVFDGAIGAEGNEEDGVGCLYLTTYYLDEDGDGYGTTPAELCGPQEGYAEVGGDCNDNSAIAYPGNPYDIVGDGIDGDCDGAETCYRDVDNDGYRSADTTDVIGSPFNINCSEFGEAYVYDPIDCDDVNPDLTAADEDGNCLDLSAADDSCSDPQACNYDSEADPDEQNCDYLSCVGCGNPGACNYDPDAVLTDESLCEFQSCADCSDPTATNYNPDAVSSDDDLCVYSGILAIAPIDIEFNDDDGAIGLYTNDVYALLPPEALQLKAVVGVKGSSIRLRVSPWDQVYQSATCGGWTPPELGTLSVEVDGITYTNDDCFNDSWFTIGGNALDGPTLVPTGFDPTTLDGQAEFDSEALASEGDTLSWALAGAEGGIPSNHCEELQGRPGCMNAVRIARFTMPIGQAFSMQAGLTYAIVGGAERTVSTTEVTDDSAEVGSESGGGGEADPPEEPGEGESAVIYGCLDPTACNYDAAANVQGVACDYDSCVGCTYSQAGNYGDELTEDDGSCVFNGCTNPAYLEYSPLANNDDGSCGTLLVTGCTDPDFLEYDAAANVQDSEACVTPYVDGCIYEDAINYDDSANRDDGTCQYAGCTDSDYLEFSDIADVDDGSCITLILSGCTDDAYLEFNPDANVLDAFACLTPVISGCIYDAASNYSTVANRDNGTCTFDFTPPTQCEAFDADGSGDIGAGDLLAFLTLFSSSCE